MISVADLLVHNRIPGNYFATTTYVRSDLELGLLETRRGDRLLALPETLIQGIYTGLQKETGQASRLVLFNCGRWWGKSFYTRFREEVSDYYGVALGDMAMAEFLQCLQQCWITYGWGKLELDHSHQHRGFLVVKTWNSVFAKQARRSDQSERSERSERSDQSERSNLPMCALEAGVLAAFFSQLTGKELHCVQTTCESMGADCNRFVLGLAPRLQPAEVMVEEHLEHDPIVERLCAT